MNNMSPPTPPQQTVPGPIRNAFTVDVEDYFQVQAMADQVRPAQWGDFPARVDRNTHRILDLLADNQVKGTFFTLGWVAERFPALVRRIADDGHELASHGYAHVRVFTQEPEVFREDIRRTKGILEEAGGVPVRGYRAATFSMDHRTPWAHGILEEEGHGYSSSLYPVKHDLYGAESAPRFPFKPNAGGRLLEIPITTARIAGRNLPVGGGGYFRLLPYDLFKLALRRVNSADGQPALFYCHPWEIDPDQPRIEGLSAKSRFRHYVNLDKMSGKMARLLKDFRWGTMAEIFSP
ncbi:MAG: XrtA system polysaccharide deacetylase [Magnetospiraceae bacterium]